MKAPRLLHPFCVFGHIFNRHGDFLVCETCGKRVKVRA